MSYRAGSPLEVRAMAIIRIAMKSRMYERYRTRWHQCCRSRPLPTIRPLREDCRSARPVRDGEAGDSPKLSLVVRDNGQLARDCLRRDQRVERPDRGAGAFELRANGRIRDCILRREIDDRQWAQKILDQTQRLDG